jgi:hypothetical protein
VPQGEGGRSIFGIKAKLFLAFCAMAGFTLSAAAIAWYAFVTIERSVDRITAGSIPAMAVSLRLAEKSAEIAAAAPALMASADQVERVLAQTRLEERSRELAGLTQELEATGIEPETVEALAEIQEQITAGLVALNAAVEERLHLNEQREIASAGMAAAHGQLVEVLEPLVDDAVFNLIISGEDLTAQSTEAITGLVEGGVGAIHQLLTVNAEVNLAAGLLAEAANALDPVLIQPIRERFIATAATAERSMGELSDFAAREALQQALDALLGLGSGEDNIFDLRERELRAIASARETLELKRERMAETLKAAHGALLEILTPIVDDATFELVIDAEDVTAENAEAITGLIDGGVTTLQVLLALRAEGNLAAGLLAEAGNISDRALIQPIRERFIAASDHIQQQLDQRSDTAESQEVRDKADRLIAFGVGDDGIFSPYALESAAQPAITETASLTAPTAVTYVRAADYNTVQIHQKAVNVSYVKQSVVGQVTADPTTGLIDATDGNPVRNELDFQIESALRQIAIDAEYTFLNGAYQQATAVGVAAKTRGVITAATTNTVAAGSATLSRALVNSLIKTMVDNGAELRNPMIFCNAWQKQKLSEIYGYAPESRTVGGVNIEDILLDFARVGVVYTPQVPAATLLIADVDVCSPVFLPVPGKGVLFYEELARTGAASSGELFGMIGLNPGPHWFN